MESWTAKAGINMFISSVAFENDLDHIKTMLATNDYHSFFSKEQILKTINNYKDPIKWLLMNSTFSNVPPHPHFLMFIYNDKNIETIFTK